MPAVVEEIQRLDTRVTRVETDISELKAILKDAFYLCMKNEMVAAQNEAAIAQLSQEMKAFKEELRRDTQAFKEEIRRDTQIFKEEVRRDTQALKDEMKAFKDEMLAFKDEMRIFKDEMLAFKDEMRIFKDEMLAFKDEMKAFKDEMRIFKDGMQDFKDEMRAFKDEMQDFKDEVKEDRKRMNKQWGELANKMGTLVEDIFSPGVIPLIRQYFNEEPYFTAIRVKRKSDALRDEFDIIAVCNRKVFLFEIKSSPDVEKAKEFKEKKLANFRILFPEYSDFEVIPFWGSLRLEEGLVKYLTNLGIYAVAFREWEYLDILNFEDVK